MAEKKLGDKIDCGTCEAHLICRMSNYEGRFADKPQYQDEDNTKAHFDKFGNCKNKPTKEEIPKQTDEKQSQLKSDTEELDIATKKIVCNETILMVKIRKEIEATLKDVVIDPHPGMVWEMTHAIWLKYFGEKEN